MNHPCTHAWKFQSLRLLKATNAYDMPARYAIYRCLHCGWMKTETPQ